MRESLICRICSLVIAYGYRLESLVVLFRFSLEISQSKILRQYVVGVSAIFILKPSP